MFKRKSYMFNEFIQCTELIMRYLILNTFENIRNAIDFSSKGWDGEFVERVIFWNDQKIFLILEYWQSI